MLEREGEPAEEIRAVLAERDADVVVMGSRRGDPEESESTGSADGDVPGSTVRALLGSVDVPVVVVPLPAL
ncbi:universal stress protein [Halosimplex aquaticum]